ncbi:hypothetical protein [Cerasicoccus frondis]|uniref:hypothetical protein n=1 Tax=Cerasicoccus frondis TaxID=490090 RepID=UPI002852DB10|nr:hypothetical protein [Cerasicoccus frondis]
MPGRAERGAPLPGKAAPGLRPQPEFRQLARAQGNAPLSRVDSHASNREAFFRRRKAGLDGVKYFARESEQLPASAPIRVTCRPSHGEGGG